MRGPAEEESRAETGPGHPEDTLGRSRFPGDNGDGDKGAGGASELGAWVGAEKSQANKPEMSVETADPRGLIGFSEGGSILSWRNVVAAFQSAPTWPPQGNAAFILQTPGLRGTAFRPSGEEGRRRAGSAGGKDQGGPASHPSATPSGGLRDKVADPRANQAERPPLLPGMQDTGRIGWEPNLPTSPGKLAGPVLPRPVLRR